MTERRGGWPGPRGEAFSVRIPPDLKARLDRHVQAHPTRNRSTEVAAAIAEYLDRHTG